LAQPKQQKRDMRFGAWDVRSLNGAASLPTAAREIWRYKLYLVGVQEVCLGQRGHSKSRGL